MAKSKTEQLKKFIADNKLDFSGYDSDLNFACTVISGYADHIGVATTGPIMKAILSTDEVYDEDDLKRQLEPVWKFAYRYNYGSWWKSAEAKREYKF